MTIHPTAKIHPSCVIGQNGFSFNHNPKKIIKSTKGIVIGSDVYIAAFCNVDEGIDRPTIIGNNCIINTHAHIAHDVQIGNNTEINVNAILCGHVTIGNNCKVAPGAVIHQRVKIGNNCVVGINAYLRHDMPDNTLCYGTPAFIRPNAKYLKLRK